MDTKVNRAGIWMGNGWGRDLCVWGSPPPLRPITTTAPPTSDNTQHRPTSDNRPFLDPNKTLTS